MVAIDLAGFLRVAARCGHGAVSSGATPVTVDAARGDPSAPSPLDGVVHTDDHWALGYPARGDPEICFRLTASQVSSCRWPDRAWTVGRTGKVGGVSHVDPERDHGRDARSPAVRGSRLCLALPAQGRPFELAAANGGSEP